VTYKSYDPAKTEGDTTFTHNLGCTCSLCGPAGTTTNVEHNEKGILETHLAAFTTPKMADLGSDHDSQKQGIYRTNSVGDND